MSTVGHRDGSSYAHPGPLSAPLPPLPAHRFRLRAGYSHDKRGPFLLSTHRHEESFFWCQHTVLCCTTSRVKYKHACKEGAGQKVLNRQCVYDMGGAWSIIVDLPAHRTTCRRLISPHQFWSLLSSIANGSNTCNCIPPSRAKRTRRLTTIPFGITSQ